MQEYRTVYYTQNGFFNNKFGEMSTLTRTGLFAKSARPWAILPPRPF
jgi:hypothetical protein